MGFLDKLQSMFGSEKKVNIRMRFDLLTEGVTGTMSKFHKARDRQEDRVVGLKLCDSAKTAQFEARFEGLDKPWEGKIATAIQHPRVVETYECGVSTKGQKFIVMEFLYGVGMHVLIRHSDPRLVGRRVSLIRQMAEAIQGVHDAGYIHRDICPRNFICSEDIESVKLIDFGLSLPDERPYRLPGNRTGTPMYMAPEIVRRRPTDKRVDMFAFGVTAYELLTFQLPWPNSEATGLGALSHDTEEPVRLSELRPDLDPKLTDAIMQCLLPLRDQRPSDMYEFLRRIRKVDEEESAEQ